MWSHGPWHTQLHIFGFNLPWWKCIESWILGIWTCNHNGSILQAIVMLQRAEVAEAANVNACQQLVYCKQSLTRTQEVIGPVHFNHLAAIYTSVLAQDLWTLCLFMDLFFCEPHSSGVEYGCTVFCNGASHGNWHTRFWPHNSLLDVLKNATWLQWSFFTVLNFILNASWHGSSNRDGWAELMWFSQLLQELKACSIERGKLQEKNLAMSKDIAAHKLWVAVQLHILITSHNIIRLFYLNFNTVKHKHHRETKNVHSWSHVFFTIMYQQKPGLTWSLILWRIGDADLGEEEIFRLANFGCGSNKNVAIETLTKSLVLRNK